MGTGKTGVLERRLDIRDIDHRPRAKGVTIVHFEVVSVRPLSARTVAIVSIIHDGKMPPCRRVEIR